MTTTQKRPMMFKFKKTRSNLGEFDTIVDENGVPVVDVHITDKFAQWLGELVTLAWQIQEAHEHMFHQCFSNPITNFRGEPVSPELLNRANEIAGKLLDRVDLPSLHERRIRPLDIRYLPDGQSMFR